MRPLIAAYWEDVGVQLLSRDNQSQIKIIKANCNGDVEGCCTKLFDVWTQRQPDNLTWQTLFEAVKNAGLVKEAENIKKKFLVLSGIHEACVMHLHCYNLMHNTVFKPIIAGNCGNLLW